MLYGKTYCDTKKTIQYVKDRTEFLMTILFFLYNRRKKGQISQNWLSFLFIEMHDKMILLEALLNEESHRWLVKFNIV